MRRDQPRLVLGLLTILIRLSGSNVKTVEFTFPSQHPWPLTLFYGKMQSSIPAQAVPPWSAQRPAQGMQAAPAPQKGSQSVSLRQG